jgi:hypothetical protein
MGLTLSVQLAGGLLLASLLSGLWLNRRGRPLAKALVTAHKLISLASAAFFVAALMQGSRTTTPGVAVWAAAVMAGLGFVAAVASGGLLSGERSLPPTILRVHQVGMAMMTVFGAATLYLLLAG